MRSNMLTTEITNNPQANARFLKAFVKRHGDAKTAAAEARKLGAMHESGKEWWCFVEARLIWQAMQP